MSRQLPTWAWLSHYKRVALRPFSNPWTVLRTAVGIAVAIIVVAKLGWNWLGLLPVLLAYLLVWCPFEALWTSRQELAALAREQIGPDDRQQEIDAEVVLKKAKAVIRQVCDDLKELNDDPLLCQEWGEGYAVSWDVFLLGLVEDPALTETARLTYDEQRMRFRKANAHKYADHEGARRMVREMLSGLAPYGDRLRPLDFHADVLLDEDRQPGSLLAMQIVKQMREAGRVQALEKEREREMQQEGDER